MTNEDLPQPDEAAAGGTPPPPPPPPAPPADPAATQPLEATAPMDPVDPTAGAAPSGAEGEPPLIVPLDVPSGPGDIAPPVTDPTAVIGATTVMGAVPDDGLPPIPPAGDPLGEDVLVEEDEEKPWYKRPGPIAAIVVAVLALVGLLAWLLLSGGDDDDVPSTASRLVLETVDQNGTAIERGFVVDVRGPGDDETAFVWLRPASATPGAAAVVSSGSNGRAALDWEPDESVADPAAWASTVTILETVPPGATPPSSVDCALERSDGTEGTVQLNSVLDPVDPAVERIATYTFPNHQFLPGDSVTCRLVSAIAGPATTVETTTATTEPAATTTPETTAAPTTQATTTAPAATTTTSIDIPPPTPTQTLWDVIENEDELSEFRTLVEDAGFRDALDDPAATFTIFAPTNDAIEAARTAGTLPSDPADLTDLLLAHATDLEALEQQQLLLQPEIGVLFGGPQPLTAAPPTVGGARILFQVPPAENGVLYLIDEVLTPVAP